MISEKLEPFGTTIFAEIQQIEQTLFARQDQFVSCPAGTIRSVYLDRRRGRDVAIGGVVTSAGLSNHFWAGLCDRYICGARGIRQPRQLSPGSAELTHLS